MHVLKSARRRAGFALCLALAFAWAGHAARAETVRAGVLAYGTPAWELDTIAAYGLDAANGFALEVVPLAGNEAAKIALQAGAVEVIVSDWIWVSRQRAEGEDLVFLSFSRATGALLVPAGSALRSAADLRGRRLGVVGGPLDKSWLLLRAYTAATAGFDIAGATEPVFGAPALLEAELEAGRLDALLTYWQSAARLGPAGNATLMTVDDMMAGLGFDPDLPLLGYVFHEAWAVDHPDTVAGFAAASRAAKALLAESDEAWQRLEPLTQATEPLLRAALREGFRAGIPGPWRAADGAEAARLFATLAQYGGAELVGDSLTLQPGTFWEEPPR